MDESFDFLKKDTPSKFGLGTGCFNSNKYSIVMVVKAGIQLETLKITRLKKLSP